MASDSLLEDVLRCRYPVDKSIGPTGFGWDTPRLNEVIAAHPANLARPVDETDFYGVADAIAQALRDCEGEDPDTCSLSPKTLRRLRMALTAARALSALADAYANEASLAGEEGNSQAPALLTAQRAFRDALYGDASSTTQSTRGPCSRCGAAVGEPCRAPEEEQDVLCIAEHPDGVAETKGSSDAQA